MKRRIEPVGIMFSEYYFYLTAFLQDVDKETEFENKNDLFPTIYRIDRIQSYLPQIGEKQLFMMGLYVVNLLITNQLLYSFSILSASGSVTQGHRWKQYWTGYPQRQ